MKHSTAHGYAVQFSAEASICRTLRRTRSSSHTCWRSMHPFAADMVTALAGVFGEGDPWTALRNLQTSLPMPLSLGELGFDKADIAEVTRQVTANPYHNPRHIDGTEIDALLERAWAGPPPRPSADSGFETVIAKEYS